MSGQERSKPRRSYRPRVERLESLHLLSTLVDAPLGLEIQPPVEVAPADAATGAVTDVHRAWDAALTASTLSDLIRARSGDAGRHRRPVLGARPTRPLPRPRLGPGRDRRAAIRRLHAGGLHIAPAVARPGSVRLPDRRDRPVWHPGRPEPRDRRRPRLLSGGRRGQEAGPARAELAAPRRRRHRQRRRPHRGNSGRLEEYRPGSDLAVAQPPRGGAHPGDAPGRKPRRDRQPVGRGLEDRQQRENPRLPEAPRCPDAGPRRLNPAPFPRRQRPLAGSPRLSPPSDIPLAINARRGQSV